MNVQTGIVVSVIITSRNEEVVITNLLKSLKRQTLKNFEILLIDNNSYDRTVEIAKRMGAKVFDFGPERSAQRNFGAKKAKGKYFLFVDADMELSENVLKQCVAVAQSDEVIGAVAIPEKSKAIHFWEKVKAFERSFYNEKGDPTTDAARFFKKEAFLKAKGYDETITGPEDWDLPETIRESGYKIDRVTTYIYHRERIPSPFVLAKKKFYYALSSYRYLKKHNIPMIGPKTIYFLRPIFYANGSWKKLLKHPVLAASMFLMLSAELVGGGLGYMVGRIKRK